MAVLSEKLQRELSADEMTIFRRALDDLAQGAADAEFERGKERLQPLITQLQE